jgi:UDP-glucose 4-epimerase
VRILVTGGAGFIGSHVVECLLDRGHTVSVADDLSAGRAENLPAGVTLHRLSICDDDPGDALAGIHAVVHAAAQTSVAASVQDPDHDAAINVLGTVRLLTAAARAGVRRFLFISSAAVYGTDCPLPAIESAPLAPASPYGLSKLAGEHYVRLLSGLTGMEWVILRLANVYGPRQSARGEAGVIARWCAALAEGDPPVLHGDGSQTRDFVYVTDVARAVALALETPDAAGRCLNIGTGRETSLRLVLQHLLGPGAQPRTGPPRPGDIARSVLDTRAVRAALGWEPEMPLETGLAATAAWAGSSGKGP